MAPDACPAATPAYGIRANAAQFAHWLLQVLLVGLALGLTRTVVPALAESEFGVPAGSFGVLAAFVVAFGVVKAVLNLVAGRLADGWGRRHTLLLGWLIALPVPVLLYWAPNWDWVVAATVLLGANQGLTWSVTQTAKLDLTRPAERGRVIGLNEFAGYAGVALAGWLTGVLAVALGTREGLLIFGLGVVLTALLLALAGVRDTRAWARAETPMPAGARDSTASTAPAALTGWQVFAVMSWRDRRLFAVSQAGLVEKFVDVLVWAFYPALLRAQGLSLPAIGGVVGVYGAVWGVGQIFTGGLSDRIGRRLPNVGGMWLCALGVALMPAWPTAAGGALAAALTGLGMALLYPNLSAAVADLAHPAWRASAIGVYRFWRDGGYAVGGLLLGAAATAAGSPLAAFWLTAAAMALSGLVLLVLGPGSRRHPGEGGPVTGVPSP